MAKKTKLELTWIGKDDRPRLEPRVLVEDPEKSYHAKERVTENDIFDNRLIFGDNLLALKALEQEFTGKVKCVFIDPPYNTGSAFEHYDDGLEHSIWLGLMRDRLEIIRNLMSENGSLWITIDDNEAHYLKVVCDEIFGRKNFVANVIWQKVYSIKGSAKHLSDMHDHILVYGKELEALQLNLIPRTEKNNKLYKNIDNDPRGPWRAGPLAARNFYSLGSYPITCPSGRIIEGPPKGSYWRFSKEKFDELDKAGKIWWGKGGNNVPAPKLYLDKVAGGTKPTTIWMHDEVGNNQDAKKEILELFDTDVFITPKPERLMERVISLATKKNDLVLDSFAGSGTTGAVAHKMGRRWIMVELGEHCHTHIIPRLKKVVDKTDPGGVTESTGWKGGGGFRYYSLAPSLLQKDDFGNWVINREYNAELLAQAVCKIEGFTYAPSDEHYWQHGHSTERDFIYVTTQTLSRQQIEALSDALGAKRSLVIYCRAFNVRNVEQYTNLTLKKIPKAVLAKCEWGHDDYSLEINGLPVAESRTDTAEVAPPAKSRRSRTKSSDQPSLFTMEGGDA